MADDKRGRDKQAHGAEKRQRQREIAAELARMDEPEPPVDESELAELEIKLDPLEFPATGAELLDSVGDIEIEAEAETYTVEELLADTEAERFESPAAVRERIQRPTIAAAMKRIIESTAEHQNVSLEGSQREGYEKTFRALKAIDADDDDEGIAVIREWIIAQLEEKDKLPGSRAVRREAAKFCRENGYRIRNDEWLGI